MEPFGVTSDGREVHAITITNPAQRLKARILSYGAALQSLWFIDRTGQQLDDVVLGCDTVAEYEANPTYLGVIVGRVAGRIKCAKFPLPGHDSHQRVVNNMGEHCLHGGRHGLSRVLWEVTNVTPSAVSLTYTSPDGDDGFPGELKVQVDYSITNDDDLVIRYLATTSAPCPVNLTNHAYFNLAGVTSPGTVEDHVVTVRAGRRVAVDADLLVTGQLTPVGPNEDLRVPTRLGDRLLSVSGGADRPGFDLYYVFDVAADGGAQATVHHPPTGRTLSMFTDQPGVQFYTANFFDAERCKGGHIHGRHAAFCLEAQNYPDAPNHPATFPNAMLLPGQEYHQTSRYHFSISN